MIDIVAILERRYPKHKFKLVDTVVSLDPPLTRQVIWCDGEALNLKWSPYGAGLDSLKGINAAALIIESMTDLVGRLLDEEFVEDEFESNVEENIRQERLKRGLI